MASSYRMKRPIRLLEDGFLCQSLELTGAHYCAAYLHRPLLTEPGLGITIDENKLMSQVGEPRPYRPSFDKDDGSIVDW